MEESRSSPASWIITAAGVRRIFQRVGRRAACVNSDTVGQSQCWAEDRGCGETRPQDRS